MNLARLLDDKEAAATALIRDGKAVSFGQLRSRVAALRAELSNRGVGPDSRVALVAGNDIEFVVGLFAAWDRGAVVSPLLPSSPVPELQRKLEALRPDLILGGGAGAWVAEQAEAFGASVLVVDEQEKGDGPEVAVIDRAGSDTALAMLTSGITSDPKVVVLSHDNLRWAQEAVVTHADGIKADDVVLGALPLSHIFGLNVVLLAALRAGVPVVLQPRFDEVECLRLIAHHKITILAGAPPMWRRLALAEGPNDAMATIRRATSGAAALPTEVYEVIKARFGVEVGQGYGLTETSSLVSWSLGAEIKPTSVGRPIEGVDVVIVDEDGAPVNIGDVGEIVVRSPAVFGGYQNADEATDAVLSDDGWFWTGDLGIFDDDGYLYIVDRAKDIVIVSGFNVYPGEVESVLVTHPDVAGAVVVGELAETTGETVVAYINVAGGGQVADSSLAQFAREHLSEYKCPTSYRFVDELPMAPTGKLIRRKLRQ